VNAPHLAMLKTRGASHALIVNNPNCSATGLAVSLRPLLDILRPRVVHVSTYQSLSGAGYPGVSSLAITDNVVPYIEGEEEKIAQETQQLLGPIRRGVPRPRALPILAHCARVATREGHLEAVTLECAGRPSLPEILSAWRQFDPLAGMDLPSAPHPPIRVRREPDRPQPLRDRWGGDRPASRGMAVSVGRVRWKAPYLRFYLLSHNAVRGGAGGSILNAELAVHLGWIPG
jgi:aspartate-semialdehyde dehydrogenase